MRYLFIVFMVCLCAVGCNRQPSAEEQGQRLLEEARMAYAEGRFEAARDTIMSLRTNHPTALAARREAILLLDSVEFQLAQGDTLKSEFYRRKLEHDKNKIKD